MPDIILLKFTVWGILFLAICLVTGRSVPDAWLFPQLSRPLQLTLIGFSILVIVLRFSFREHTPIIFGFSILIILGVMGLIRFVLEIRKTRNPVSVVTRLRQEAWVCLLLMLPATAILFFPYMSSGAIFFQNRGPDLDGHS